METKIWYQSKTIQGLGVMILGLLVRQFGLPLAETEFASVIAFILQGIGGIVVFYGRLKAEGKIEW